MSEKIHISVIRGGQFENSAVRRIIAAMEGECVEVVIRPRRRYTGQAGRADYWGNIIPPIAQALRDMDVRGEGGGPITDQEVHKGLAKQFLTKSFLIDPTTGEYEDRTVSTSDLTETEFNSYKHIIISWAMDFFGPDFKLPERNEYQRSTLA